MAQIAFWGPNVNQTGSTSIAASVGSVLALEQGYKTLLLSANHMDNTLETSFLDVNKLVSRSSVDFTNIGIDALERLIKSGKLGLENLVDYTTPILKDRLDILFGTQKKEKEIYDRIMEIMPNVLKCASTVYDVVLVDVPSGTPNENTMKILQSSDLIVININQSVNILDEFFHEIMTSDLLKEKKFILVLGRYDRYSKYNAKNLSKLYKYKKSIYTLPYNTQFFDMQNEHRVFEFFIKYLNIQVSDRNGFFVNQVKSLAEEITQNVAINYNK